MKKYATRESCFRPSPVRAVFETAMRPDVISLAGGNPDLSFLDHQFISEIIQKQLQDNGLEVLQYGSGAGTDKSRELAVALMEWGGAHYQVDQIQMTSGSQAGLDAVTKLLCNPGDVIIAEAPTYVGVLGTFGAYETEVRQVPLDAKGLNPQAVAAEIDAAQAQGKTVRFVYTISAFQNPSGMSLAPERHAELIEVCARRGVWVVEDDAYGLLGFEALKPPSGTAPNLPLGADYINRAPMLAALSPEHVIHLGSFSKIFSPGARVGWIGAPKPVRERLQIACESVCITPSVLAQTLVENYVGTPAWKKGLLAQVAAYRERRDVAIACARQMMPEGTTWEIPEGGFFLWMKLPSRPGGWGDVLELGLSEKVVVIPGSGCYVGPEDGTHVRIAFSAVTGQMIRQGMEHLSRALA